MIIARAPFRISFAGGGSDLEEYYSKSEGAVLSTTINKYMYVMIHPYFHDKIRIKYSKTEDVDRIDDIQHPIVRECLRLVGIEQGIEIASIADVPAGTGLGSSSAFTVALLSALFAFKGQTASKQRLAEEACRIEIAILKEPIGKQDQYASAFGGMNQIKFKTDGAVLVEPAALPGGVLELFRRHLVLFYVGNERPAAQILSQQKKNMAEEAVTDKLRSMVAMTYALKQAIAGGQMAEIARLMAEGWALKRKLTSGISNDRLDLIYDKAIKAGAGGGKLLGAGGGGFFLFFCDPAKQANLRKEIGLRELAFDFESAGVKLIYNDMAGR